jgi:YD repeat-containing protein
LVTAYRDPVGNRTTFMYDASLNLTTILNALGETTTMAYTGRLMTGRTNVRGDRETFTYDGGLLKTYTDQRGLVTAGGLSG